MHRGIVVLLLATAAGVLGPVSESRVEGQASRPAFLGPSSARDTPSPAGADRVHAPRDLDFFYDLYTFRGDTGATRVVAAFAVPVGELEREREARGVRYRFDVTLVVADTLRQSVYRTDDSVYVAVPSPLSGRHLLFTQVEIDAAPSTSTQHRVIMTDAGRPGVGRLHTAPYPIPDYSGNAFLISDLALGQPTPRRGWTRGDVTLALLPTSQFPGSSFDLYYELYNIPSGTPYATEIAIERVSSGDALPGSGTDVVRARFSEVAVSDEDDTLRELRFLEASLDPGRYLLTVTVTDERRGATVQRSRAFRVRRGSRGATMVPALPAARIRR